MCSQSKNNAGFTLIELMVTVSIAAILIGMAIPSFTDTIASNRLTANANEMVTALNFARSEAIKRGTQVTIARLSGTNKKWESGWQVFVDINGDGILDDTSPSTPCETNASTGSPTEDCLLRNYDVLPNGYTLRSGNNFACWVAYTDDGANKGSGSDCSGGLSNDTFTLCDGAGTTSTARKIIIFNGRARVEKGATACP